ncbi:hypothetical protein H310_03460 [Aphanomyces invadans]|uniref:Chromo domain-containing protein n=1 Tax=Aphanomyces invadans TaxID=157072 RepID=A0A024UH80_9STRA|nr:hypothetical protein H310_03460 [Aphanomyces invadans]ETW05776.1 hypothetical protein H310_03460 [Aphanomyces invadans]|eukprot:XP_008865553.1 hypothetical protein H310_03460 [Aphanomyces invadans]
MGPMELRPYGADSQVITVTKQVRLRSLEFKTACGPLLLRGLRVWDDETVALIELTLGLPVMQKLAELNPGSRDASFPASRAVVKRYRRWRKKACATPELGDQPQDVTPVRKILEAKFGRDPPVKVEPLKVRLKDGAVPVKMGLRRYPPTHLAFLEKHVRELEEAGQADAVAYCEGVVDELFGELLMHGILGWLDELLGYARTSEELLRPLRQVVEICHSYEISATGVAHAPGRVHGLCDLEPPQTAADLQQFLCATNWMREKIPHYTELVAPLTKLFDIAAKAADSRKKAALTRVSLSLGAVATQVPIVDLALPAGDQRHEPLAFLSGAFRGASERWLIVEKEAFAVVESSKRLEYLLIRPGGFRLFSDHRNLVYSPQAPALGADDDDVPVRRGVCGRGGKPWADLLSLWGSPPGEPRTVPEISRGARMSKLALVSPLRHEDFVWTTTNAISELQRGHPDCEKYAPEKKCFLTASGKIWIPGDALDMQMRISVAAHGGVAGHRRVEGTASALNQQPTDHLDGVATTAFTGLPSTPPLSGLATALENMHKHVSGVAEVKRTKARERRESQRAVKLAKFTLGDFVLMARALKHLVKLTLRWKGPFRVVKVVSDYLMEVQQPVPPGDVSLHHASRLRLYCEGGRDVDEDLKAQIAFGDEDLRDLRLRDGVWEVLIKWFGLGELESSWEPAMSIYEDAFVLFRRWAKTRSNEEGVKRNY